MQVSLKLLSISCGNINDVVAIFKYHKAGMFCGQIVKNSPCVFLNCHVTKTKHDVFRGIDPYFCEVRIKTPHHLDFSSSVDFSGGYIATVHIYLTSKEINR